MSAVRHRRARRTGEGPILESKEVSIALLAGLLCLVFLGGLPTKAYASGPESEEVGTSVPAHPDRIVGHWRRGEGEAVIEITQQAGGYHGVIVASERRPETVGIEVFRQLRYDADTRTWHGRAYSIKRKREVRIDITVPSADQLDLAAHILIFIRRVRFSRLPNAGFPGGQLAER